MPPTGIQRAQVDNRSAQPPARCLDLDLRPNGSTDHIRLSGCTFAYAIDLCVGSMRLGHAWPESTAITMATPSGRCPTTSPPCILWWWSSVLRSRRCIGAMSDDQSLGLRIKRARKRRQLTQEQLAERAEVSVDLVRKLEQKVRHTASMSSLTRLARALDVDVPQLLGQAGTIEPMVDEEAVGILAIRDELTLLSYFPGLVDEEVFDDAPPTVEGLRLAVAQAESRRQHGSFAQLGAMLPGLMAEVRAPCANCPAMTRWRPTACCRGHPVDNRQGGPASRPCRSTLGTSRRRSLALLPAAVGRAACDSLLICILSGSPSAPAGRCRDAHGDLPNAGQPIVR